MRALDKENNLLISSASVVHPIETMDTAPRRRTDVITYVYLEISSLIYSLNPRRRDLNISSL